MLVHGGLSPACVPIGSNRHTPHAYSFSQACSPSCTLLEAELCESLKVEYSYFWFPLLKKYFVVYVLKVCFEGIVDPLYCICVVFKR